MRELTLRLIRIPSVNGTPEESAFPDHLRQLLLELPAFAAGDRLQLRAIPGDPHRRRNLFALAGEGGPTVILSGHYDVVSTRSYGALEPLACDPTALLPALRETLRRESGGDPLAERDLETDDWVVGRGALDMKSGLACGIAVLERWAEAGRPGSLLLVATPDEEGTSAGMRAAIPQIVELCSAWDLQPVAALNLDVTDDHGDGSDGRAVFLGSVGKLLPFVHLVGRETHAGAPPLGLNAALMAAEVTRRVELSPELVDETDGEVDPPPVALHQTDSRQGYDVTTPRTAWCYYNLLRHAGSAGALFERFLGVVREAVDAAAELTQKRGALHLRRSGDAPPPRWRPRVLTFAELRALAGAAAADAEGAGQDSGQDSARHSAPDATDLPERARRVTEALWEAAGLAGPAAVVGCAGVPYAPVLVGDGTKRERRLVTAVERQARAVGQLTGQPIRLRAFFPGISDMSFFADGERAGDDVIAANTPGWGHAIRIDREAAGRLQLPIVNIGPWGRDYHQRWERVFAPYAFRVVPELLWRVAGDLLG